MTDGQIKTKQRVADYGEVYTAPREVNAMLDLVKQETERIESRFLEPACGTGNFLLEVLSRKLTRIVSRYAQGPAAARLEYERYAVSAVSSLYGIDILEDNVLQCRSRLFAYFQTRYIDHFGLFRNDDLSQTVQYILDRNIIRGDALTLKTVGENPRPIVFSDTGEDGIAITELTAHLTRRSVYCSKHASGKYSVCDEFDDDSGNIRFDRTEHTWKDGRCVFCGANQENYDRGEELETHAYQFIHTEKPEEFFNMKFDVIVGNPPYQLSTGGSGRQAKPIYHYFVQQAKKMRPRYLAMIIPDRWFAGGMGLGDFRKEMLEDKQIRKLVDYANSKDCFPGPDIPGGICYFLWEKDTTGNCEVINIYQGRTSTSSRKLDEFETFIRFEPAVKILRQVVKFSEEKMTQIISGVRPFGIPTKARPEKEGELMLVSSGGSGHAASSIVTSGQDMVNKWKVLTSKTSHDHAGQSDNEGRRRVLSRVEILPPKYVCTESYIILGSFETKKEAENCLSYVTTRFVRFLVSLLSFSQDITRERFAYVPMQDFSEPWTDEKLYKKYGLTQDEIAFIESMIRPMEAEGEK